MNGESTLALKEQNHLQAGYRGSTMGPEDWAMFLAGETSDVRLKEPPASDILSLGHLSSAASRLGLQFCVSCSDNLAAASAAPYKDIPFPMIGLCTSELSQDIT